METIKQTKALCLIRLRLLWNTLRSKTGFGKIIVLFISALLMIIATVSGANDLLEAIYKLPYANLIAEWITGFLVLYAIFIVFTGDLVSGHTLNTGQLSSDFHYLSTLPIKPVVLIITKIFERLITDYFGILFLLPALVGISCYKTYSLKAILVAVLIYIEAGFLIGIFINLIHIFLTRFFKPSTINNFYSVFGYISAILTLIPFLLISDFKPSYVSKIIDIIDYMMNTMSWLFVPIRWISAPLLYATPMCSEFYKLSILWLSISILLVSIHYFAIKNNWFNYSHSNKKQVASLTYKKIFKGIFYKEFLMLKSDFNLLINAIFMPISIIIIEIYFLKQVFSFTSLYTVINFIFGSIVYFSMFGPINIIGYEGKAISLLESMPISPQNILKNKFYFWSLLALLIFIPSTIIALSMLGFSFDITLKAILMVSGFTFAAVGLTICLSAIFAQYNTSVLQQRSTFMGKMAAVTLLSILLPIKTVNWHNLFSLLLFILISYFCYAKAKTHLAFRQDKEAFTTENQLKINCSLLLLSFAVIENNISQLFRAVTPDSDTGIWAWALSLAAMLPFICLAHKKNTPIIPKLNLKSIPSILLTSGIPLIISFIYFKYLPSTYHIVQGDFKQIINFFSIISITKPLWKIIVFIMASLFMTSVTMRIYEYFLVRYNNRFNILLGILLTALVSAPDLIPLTIIYLTLLFVLNNKNHNSEIFFYSSIIYYFSLFAFLIY